ncbi:PstS family phosphate ABC transporter substrate-binding protein [Trichothermofontia sichuanensis B231]|uniref:PstS family phosphate ABC transporter substrate-binding protein n=1 Tax=Trichothermofontia sichuanensis TaxID=3045816 RepID=UPI0022456F42|nr:PstS family phosphate ABC transporter substrate-binding protein [Trichothermofontia sichuanensis]UZQ53390.1 PstS family phosphate ABC transporter substrate-binding protein [Trichothermofontia sichuanensis B231]
MVASHHRFEFKQSVARAIAAGVAIAGTLGLLGTEVNAQAARNLIKIDGSSTVFPITEAVAEEFEKSQRAALNVTVGISGTGGGFKKFCNGETDISNASRPIKAAEMQECKAKGIQYIELPVAYDALTVVINPRNTWATRMTVADLKKIWSPAAEGRIRRWNQVRPEWPNQPLDLYGPGADSGTFDYFTEAIVGKAQESRGDFTASEDDNVLVQGVSRNQNALGYFGFSYYEANRNRLRAVAIDNGNGPVMPSRQTVENGTYQPLSRPLFIYVSTRAAQRPAVQSFVQFYLNNVPKLAAEVGYIPLPAEAYRLAKQNFAARKTGSVFANRNTIGVKIADLLRLEAQH